LVLLELDSKRHNAVFAKVAPFLDGDLLADFDLLHSLKRAEERLRLTESTVNRLRAVLSPISKAIFSVTARANTIDIRAIIQSGGIILWKLRPSEYFSSDQKVTLGQLAIHEVIAAMLSTPREMRRRFTLIVDEAGEFINEE